MTTLVINGKKVKVSDDFLKLSPEEQNRAVDEIARSIGAAKTISDAPTATPAPEPAPAAPAAQPATGGAVPAMGLPANPELMTQGPGPTGSISPELYDMGILPRRFVEGMPKPEGSGQPSLLGDLLKSAASGAAQGGMETLGVLGTGADMTEAGVRKVAGLLGIDPANIPEGAVSKALGMMIPGAGLSGADLRGLASGATGGATEYDPKTTAGEYAQTVGQFIGGGAKPMMGIAGGLASEGLGQLTEGTAAEPYARLVGALGGSLAYQGLSGLVSTVKRNKAIRGFLDETPDVAALKSQAGALYDEARAAGVTAAPAQVNTFADDMVATLRGEAVITPKGRVAKSYPKVSDVIDLIDDYRGSPMTPTEMLQVRTALQTAAQSADPREARIGSILIRRFDDFTGSFAPQIADANSIYRHAMQGKLIETTIELAGSRAGQFSGSGFENALRTEFRGLDRQIIKGDLKVTPDEAALIKRIAQGGFAENLARDVGKAAPRGVVSAGAAGGVPFAIGTAMGSPALGLALGGGTLAAGEIGRRVATAMQTKNANLLSALARSGGNMPAEIAGTAGQNPIARMTPGLLAQ